MIWYKFTMLYFFLSPLFNYFSSRKKQFSKMSSTGNKSKNVLCNEYGMINNFKIWQFVQSEVQRTYTLTILFECKEYACLWRVKGMCNQHLPFQPYTRNYIFLHILYSCIQYYRCIWKCNLMNRFIHGPS